MRYSETQVSNTKNLLETNYNDNSLISVAFTKYLDLLYFIITVRNCFVQPVETKLVTLGVGIFLSAV